MARQGGGQRVLGPYYHEPRRCWRVIVVLGKNDKETHYFATEAEGKRARAQFEGELRAAIRRTVWEAIEEYRAAALKDNKKSSQYQTTWALKTFFPDEKMLVTELNPTRCKALYKDLSDERRTRRGKKFAAACHRNVLSQAKTFLRWCVKQRYLDESPLEDVEPTGRVKKGKLQLRRNELRLWDRVAVKYLLAGEEGAVAALMTYYLGMRTSEIVGLKVRDVDDDGQLVCIWADDADEGKTDAAQRDLTIPDFLRPFFLTIAGKRNPDEPLFVSPRSKNGHYWRSWPCKWVQRICREAGVRRTTAHGMRGKRSSRAVELGAIGQLLARDMGHDGPVMTFSGPYVQRSAVENAEQARRLALMGKTGPDPLGIRPGVTAPQPAQPGPAQPGGRDA